MGRDLQRVSWFFRQGLWFLAMRAAARRWRRRARRGELRGRCVRCVGHSAAWLLTFLGGVWALLLATCLYHDAPLWLSCVPSDEAMMAPRQVGGSHVLLV